MKRSTFIYRLKMIIKVASINSILLLSIFASTNCSNGFETVYKTGSSFLSSETLDSLSAGRNLYSNHCASCHGAVDSSTKRDRTEQLISLAISDQPQMRGLSFLSRSQISYIAEALSSSSSAGGSREIFACDPTEVPKTPLLKLTNREFRASLNSILDSFSPDLKSDGEYNSLLDSIPSDILRIEASEKEQPNLLTSGMASAYFEAAFRAGFLVTTDSSGLQNYPNTGGCLSEPNVSDTCFRSFVQELGSLAFRRPLSVAEVEALVSNLWDSSLDKSELLQVAFTSIAQSPEFMYKIYDRGPDSPRGTNVVNLTAYELAAKVSYFVTGGPPDSTLRQVAASGQIQNLSVLEEQLDRLMETPGGQAQIVRFYRESYGYDIFDSFSYSDEFLGGQDTENLREAMTAELDDYFTSVTVSQSGTFNDLMTSRSSSLTNTNLANIYGFTVAPGQVTLPVSRSGFLNRAAMLAKTSGETTSPVKRGVSILNDVLCSTVGSPPPDAPTAVAPPELTPDGYLTTRERYALSTERAGTSCVACHSKINNLGYPFELFDSIGRQRSFETVFSNEDGSVVATLPVSTTVTTSELVPSPITLADSQSMVSELGTNQKAMMCFVKKLKEFEARRTPTSAHYCQMNESLNSLSGTVSRSPSSIKDAIKDLILAEDFRIWSY